MYIYNIYMYICIYIYLVRGAILKKVSVKTNVASDEGNYGNVI